jgi:hypothetical protein
VQQGLVTHRGGCHCGRVRFEVEAPAVIAALDCNCSMCRSTGFLHLIVPREQFRLLAGEEFLVNYQFGTRTARHLFCGTCGIKSFYVPRSHPEGFSINVHCLDHATVREVRVSPYDGRNWEQARADLDINQPSSDAAAPRA